MVTFPEEEEEGEEKEKEKEKEAESPLSPSPKVTRFPGTGTQKDSELLEQRLADFVQKLHSYQKSWEGEGKRQCPGPREDHGLGDQDSMSQRPSASRPASRSPPEGQRITLPPVQLRDDPRFGGRPAERQPEHDSRGYPQPPHLLTSPHPRASNEDWRLAAAARSRDLGVHSILNPTEPDHAAAAAAAHVRRQSGGTTGSPLSASGVPGPGSHFAASPSSSNPHPFPSHASTASTPPVPDSYRRNFPERRILTPRSPRAISLGRIGGGGGGPGTIDAQQTPFLTGRSRPYGGEHRETSLSEVTPGPPPTGHTPQYRFQSTASTPQSENQPSMSTMQAPAQTPHSQSASPSVSVSSQNLSTQTSPASQFPYQQGGKTPQTSGSYFPGSTFGGGMQQPQQSGGVQFQAPTTAPEGQGPYTAPQTGSSIHSSTVSQASATDPVQVLTIATHNGVTYHVPVDVHQASRLADEKRARNAGASARFRQRRKEKEKEASTNIEKLQQQNRELDRKMREIEQERDFYRADRDRLREVMFRTPGMREMAMGGPPSPHTMRSSSFQGLPPQQPPGPPQGFPPPPESGERPARRRRTDTQGDFAPLTYSLPPATTLPPVQAPGYPPRPGQGPPSLPPLRMDNPNTPGEIPNQPPSTTQGGPPPSSFEPYPRQYERGWHLPPKGGDFKRR